MWPVYARAARRHRRTLVRETRVVSVVGSFGKTSTTRAVAVALGLEPPESGANCYIPLAKRILGIRPGDRHAAVEVGISHPGQMAGFARVVQPDIVVVTTIGNTHQENLHTLENTSHEKGFMIRALPASGLAVLNGDNPHVLRMADWTRARVVTFGMGPDNDVRASDVHVDPPKGTRFTLHVDGESRDVTLPLLGKPTVYAALAAVAVARAEGRCLEDVLRALSRLLAAPGRLQLLELGDVVVLRDDQKGSLDSTFVALDVFERLPAERKIVTLHQPNDEQDPDEIAFPPLGARLAEIADRLLFLGTPARFEQLIRGAGGREPAGGAWQRLDIDMVQVLERLPPLRAGDALLLKGPMTSRFHRVLLGLSGRAVRCRAPRCDARLKCDRCPMLERGWGGRRIVI